MKINLKPAALTDFVLSKVIRLSHIIRKINKEAS